MHTAHFELDADEVFDVPHERTRVASEVGVVGQVSADVLQHSSSSFDDHLNTTQDH